MTSVPKLWPGETFVLLGSGPSLTPEDVALVRGRARVIAINSGYQIAPFADVLYACDVKWWKWHDGAPSFAGLKFSMSPDPVPYPDVQILRDTGLVGLETDPTGLRSGRNSGYQAINVAVHLGAARIILLGYDLSLAPNGRKHWHPDHPSDGFPPSPYAAMLECFPTLVDPLAALGVSIVNCTRRTALRCFPCVTLEEALSGVEVAA